MKKNNLYKNFPAISIAITIAASLVVILTLALLPNSAGRILAAIVVILLCDFWVAVALVIRHTVMLLSSMERLSVEDVHAIVNRYKWNPILNSIGILLNRENRSAEQQQAAELLKQRSQLLALQSQINPHFLYNTLESIRGEALVENVPRIAEMTKRLSALFRYSISSHHSLITLREELANVQNYMAIQKFRFRDKLSLQVTLEDESCLDNLILKMTLQPLVENAVYHGLEALSHKGIVSIRVTKTSKKLLITLSDNGRGIDPDHLREINNQLRNPFSVPISDSETDKSTGIALVNICKRIKLDFGMDYGFIIQSIPEIGTDVEISLPLVAHTR